MNTTAKVKRNAPRVNLKNHHALCEMNFYRLEKLIPGYKNGISQWSWQIGVAADARGMHREIEINIIDRAPYTTTVEIIQETVQHETRQHETSQQETIQQRTSQRITQETIQALHKNPERKETNAKVFRLPNLVVRLYNDVNMAEIICWDKHRNWLPQYSYPNERMYHPDEKLELNRFLGDWLTHCRKQGFISFKNCEQVLVYRK